MTRRRDRPTAALVIGLVLVARGAAAQSGGQPAANDRPQLTFSGTIVANVSVAGSQLFVPDVPVWALTGPLTPPPIGGQPPGVPIEAEDVRDVELTARQSRLGLGVTIPAGESRWTPSGRVEVDFFGARPVAGQGTSFNQVRLRLAFVSLKHESGWGIVAGQDWIVFAPLNPSSFTHFAIPLAASGGNPWMRLPQVRVERTLAFGGASGLVQAAIVRPVGGGDSPAPGSLGDSPSLAGERSGQPFYQARLAITPGGTRGTMGVSGHYGRENAETNTTTTWGIAADATWPVAARLTVSGELWSGANLDTFQAGIAQGLALRNGRFDEVHAAGGWVQLQATLPSNWTLTGGVGQDDPRDEDLAVLVTRARNRVVWGGATVKLHPHVTLALQHTFFSTRFRDQDPAAIRDADGHHTGAAFVFAF